MRKRSLLFFLILCFCLGFKLKAQDTITVQTFTFGSAQDAWFIFPADTVKFEKILMQYTLKCNLAQSPACGEWDYQTYTYLYDYTGLTDSSMVHQPVFKMNGNVTDSIAFSYQPTYQNTGHWQQFLVYTDTTQLLTYSISSDNVADAKIAGASYPVSRSFFMWKASELSAAGVSAGNISGLRLEASVIGSLLKNFRIRIKQITADTFDVNNPDLVGLTEVYNKNTQLIAGWNSFSFLHNFTWDGVSNLVIEFSYENKAVGTDAEILGSQVGFDAGMYRRSADRCLKFADNGFVQVNVNDVLNEIDSIVTLSFWAYGDVAGQPQDGTCFEAINASDNRVLNAHVPWSNLNVYWDAGNSGGSYDRINKAATTVETEGKWNQWTMVKNAVNGSMKIYLNGELWHSGTGKTRPCDDIDRFFIGKGSWDGSPSYAGRMDDFAIFKTELSADEIAQNYKKSIDASFPHYDSLVMNFNFNDGNGSTVTDAASGNGLPSFLINTSNPLKGPDDLIFGFGLTTFRPNVVFERGTFVSHTDSVFVTDSVAMNPIQIIMYDDSLNNPGVATDTLMVWPAGYYRYIYGANGQKIDSVKVLADTVYRLKYYDYFNYFPQVKRYELARYITPYGNGLSLGEGWTWTFDVSDYRTLLSDSVRLAAGNWQELLDMKFLMIKGTPPRDVISIQNLWNGTYNYGHSNDPIESHLTPIKVKVPSEALNARWKSRVTGHGMDTPENCAEFCAKHHYYKVGGVQRYDKLIWRDNCDLNPLFPQGGTWVYDRSNWCPGAEVWTYDLELSPFIVPGDSVELDHDVQPYTNNGEWSYYLIEDQLVYYGAPNFTLDAAIENVLSPTTDHMWKRLNPICSAPLIEIKNTGSTPLTSLDIKYGIKGAGQSTYHWTGNLAFLETTRVELDTFMWAQGASAFTFEIMNPNGGVDQYPNNNKRETKFSYVPVLPGEFVIEFKTNSRPSENEYTLCDQDGNVLFQRDNVAANTIYKDTVNLTTGCYFFKITDSGEDGLQWWANSSQGSGYIKFRNLNNTILKNFVSDFGGEIAYQFTVGLSSGIENYSVVDSPEMKVWPNPTRGELTLDFNLPYRTDGSIEIVNMLGNRVYYNEFKSYIAESRSVDMSAFPKGVYFITLKTPQWLMSKKIILQ